MKLRRSLLAVGLLCLLVAGAAAALLLANRRDVTTSSSAAYQAYLRGVENERRFYKKEAQLDFARAIELDPEFAEAILGLSRMAEHEQAVSLVERAWTLRDRLTERERLHVDLQRASLNYRKDEMLQLAKTLHEKYPDDITGVQILAALESDDGHPDKAVALYKELLKADPNYALAYNYIGYSYGYRGEYEKAIENFQKYQFMAPDQPNPLDSMGEIQAFSGHYDEAIDSLQKALAIKPDFFDAVDHLAVAYEGKGDYLKAIECYEKASDFSLTNDFKEIELIRALRVALYAKDAVTGERLMQKVEALPKGEFSALRRLYLGAVRDLFAARYAEAERRLSGIKPKMVEELSRRYKNAGYKPYEPSWNLLMAKAKIAQGKDAEAIPLLEEMVNPPNPWVEFEGRRWVYAARAQLAALLAKRGDLDRAEKLIAENHKWNADWAPTRGLELAVMQARREKIQTAAK